MKIITDLPMRGKYINWKKTINMIIEVEHEEYGKVKFRVINYIPKRNRLFLDYNGYMLDDGIFTGNLLNGNIGTVINITNSSKNTFHLDENNILHIYGENKDGKWEALYSGKYVDEVMNSTWYTCNDCIQTTNYNFKGRYNLLHHVDIKPKPNMVIDHMSNSYRLINKWYDCRLENLREISLAENSKNKNCNNDHGYTGLNKNNKGWISRFKYNGVRINTKTKQDYNEAILDNLIAQKYLGYKHQEEEFWKLDGLSEDRVKEVTDLLDEKIKKADGKIHEVKEYEYDIEEKDGCYILRKNGHEMLFDCDLEYIKDKCIYPNIRNNRIYWYVNYIKNNKKINNKFYRHILGFKPNEYLEYKIHIDHLNNNPSDNRFENLVITTSYSNQCNKVGLGYRQCNSGGYKVYCMNNYEYWVLIDGVKEPTFKTEQEAIAEVNRRKSIVENSRVKLKSKQELDKLIQYCLDNNYLQENGLADLDLGYLYWKGILKITKTA